uniref:Uncharacterized protein n=1 Tax=Abalone asfa-like virus TaxID=2839893 RepID=A0A5K7XYM4_9VIRU|nr:hypothetical protein [Abalone asfa-like virus]BCY04590.1 hypothetical protein [Abalone asfa-like virus]
MSSLCMPSPKNLKWLSFDFKPNTPNDIKLYVLEGDFAHRIFRPFWYVDDDERYFLLFDRNVTSLKMVTLVGNGQLTFKDANPPDLHVVSAPVSDTELNLLQNPFLPRLQVNLVDHMKTVGLYKYVQEMFVYKYLSKEERKKYYEDLDDPCINPHHHHENDDEPCRVVCDCACYYRSDDNNK